MTKRIFLATGILLGPLALSAQNEIDAYRLSQQASTSTALSLGMGGVGGSMGGDFNSLSINPAGIGVYRSGEISITPSIRINQVTTNFDGSETTQNSSKFNFENVGLVFQSTPRSGKWKSFSIGIGMNTIANYNYKERIYGENNQSSISDIMSASAYSFGVEENTVPPYGFLGYQGYLLDEDYVPVYPISQGLIQDKFTHHKGSAQEYNITLGGNYNEQLHLGVGLGLVSHSYTRSTNFYETDATSNPDNYFDYANLDEVLTTSGLGVNVKLGAIYVPNRNSRFGISFHTPTWTALTDNSDYLLQTNTESYKYDMGYTDSDPVSVAQPSAPYQYNYSLRTPWKLVLSGTVLGKMGMISADYELTDFASMKYTMTDAVDYERFINEEIQKRYGMASTFRLGGELVLDQLFLRAGGAYQTSPHQDADTYDGTRLDLSLGAGLRWRSFFIDLGYMNRQYFGTTNLYDVIVPDVYNPNISSKLSAHYVSLTLGMKMRR